MRVKFFSSNSNYSYDYENQKINEDEYLIFKGLAWHIGSQILSLDGFEKAAIKTLKLCDRLNNNGINVTLVDLGGGLGVPYKEEEPPSPKELIQTIEKVFIGRNEQIILEPGRSISANSGILITKVEYIKNTYNFFYNNSFDFENLSDEDVIKELTKIKGVGEWTAQMFLIFNLFRQNIFSPKDLALINSIKINYDIHTLDKIKLDKLVKLWSPYNSIACLLLWESVENKFFFKA